MPNETPYNLLEGLDSIHFVLNLGNVKEDGCVITLSQEGMMKFIDVIETLDARGAIREENYVVCCMANTYNYMVAIHTTKDFLSDEDFDSSIQRFYA